MATEEELEALMRAVQEKADRAAFGGIFGHFAPRLKGFLARSGLTAALAEELAQETMVVLWRQADRFDPTRARLTTWVYTIARNLLIDHRRRQGVRGPTGVGAAWLDDLLVPQPDPQPDEQAVAGQRAGLLAAALAALPAEQSLVLRMSYFEEHPHAAIARTLGIPLGTVKSRIRLAMEHLKSLLVEAES
ncbi:MAG TPA: sigma-70 family RNA polymerase sigma factor [Steroidobacteraceae bacterium]|nr:sigma-70 family RNA polymerase sigma factor [Steroidobacteraceae bacterium]